MTTNQSVSVLRTPAAWLLFGAMALAVCAFAWALRFDSQGPSVANGVMALVVAGASIGLLAVGAVRQANGFPARINHCPRNSKLPMESDALCCTNKAC